MFYFISGSRNFSLIYFSSQVCPWQNVRDWYFHWLGSSHDDPARLLRPWDSPGKNTGMGCHAFLQAIFPTQGLNSSLLHCRQILYQLSYQGSLWEGKGYPFQYSCQENSIDGGAWWAIVQRSQRVGHDWVTNTFLVILEDKVFKYLEIIKKLTKKNWVLN